MFDAHVDPLSFDQALWDPVQSGLGPVDDLFEWENEVEWELDSDEVIEALPEIAHVAPSEFAEFALTIPIKGELSPFRFEGRRYLRDIYDSNAKRALVVASRQTEKSTFLGNLALCYSALTFSFRTLYVNSSSVQATDFSRNRLKDPIETSEVIQRLVNHKVNQNVFFKQFMNRSQIVIRYAFLTADRTRGTPPDAVLIDEIQDILSQNIPVIEQGASHSAWGIFRYAGTPKSLDNTINVYWVEQSTQNEWVIPCDYHSPRHWNIMGPRNIGKEYPICDRCGHRIYPMHPDAVWASMQPRTQQNENRVRFDGYRICRLMTPWVQDEDKWKELLQDVENYPTAQLHNEVFGLSYDSGERPISSYQVRVACNPDIRFDDLQKNAQRCNGGVFGGLDHGPGTNASFTLLTLGGYIDGVYQIIYAHRFVGEDLDVSKQLSRITRKLVEVQFTLCGADHGGGHHPNDWLMRNFGMTKFWRFQYADNPGSKVRWNPKKGFFLLHRTDAMAALFSAIIRKQVKFPRWEEFRDPYGADICNIFKEYNPRSKQDQFKVSPGKSDDTFHSILYGLLISMLKIPRPDILIPTKADDVNFSVAA